MNDNLPPNRASLFDAIIPELGAYRKAIFVRNDKFDYNRIPAKGTTLKDSFLASIAVNCDGIMDWVFSHAEPHRTDGWHAFYFVQSRTGNTAYTPVLTHGGSEHYDWPDEIEKYEFTSDSNIPLTVTAISGGDKGVALLPRWFLDLKRNPGPSGNWPCKVNHYLGSEAFPMSAFGRLPSPDPGEIAWDLAGHSDRIRGLHTKGRVPVQSGNYATQISGVTGYLGGAQEWRALQATNMRKWSEFSLHDQMQFKEGLWHWVEVIIQPPPRRKPESKTISI